MGGWGFFEICGSFINKWFVLTKKYYLYAIIVIKMVSMLYNTELIIFIVVCRCCGKCSGYNEKTLTVGNNLRCALLIGICFK